MLKLIAALSVTLAAPALAQTAPVAPPAPPSPPATMGPPPEFIQAAQGFGQCVGTSAKASDAKATPEAAAKAALAGCQAEKAKMETSFEGWISGPSFPAEGRDTARAQFKSEMAAVETQIADEIRKARAGAAAK